MTTFASIIAILALLTGGGAGTVYAAQDSMPNNALYAVKIASEELRLNMADDSAQQLSLLLQFSERRGDEIETMLAEGEEPPAEVLLKLNQQTQQAMQLAGTLDGAAQLQVQNMIQNQMQRMLNLQENASGDGAMLMEQVRMSLQNQLMLMGNGAGQGQGQGQAADDPEEVLPEEESIPEPGQGQSQGQGQGSGDGNGNGQGGQDATTPAGSGNGQGQQNNNQGVDPCAAYYASLAQGDGASQGNGGKGNGGGGQGSQGESQGPVVYGLNGEICVPPTAIP